MLGCITTGATAIWVVAIAPRVAALCRLAQAAALCQAEGLSDTFLSLHCICIQGNQLVCSDVALEGVAVLCCTASKGWAELRRASGIPLQVLWTIDVFGVCWRAGPLLWCPFSSTCTPSAAAH